MPPRVGSDAWMATELARKIVGRPEDILDGSFEMHVPGGASIFHLDGDHPFILGVMVSGLARVYTMSAHGRQATIRYVTDGDILGLPVALAPTVLASEGIALAVQAVTDCDVLRLSVPRFREVVARNPTNMWGLLEEMARSMIAANNLLAENVFMPVRCRVARHMLDMAARRGEMLVVNVSQQEIADAIGSVREVVSRALLRLRDDGLIHREGAAYVIDSPAGLHAAAVRS